MLLDDSKGIGNKGYGSANRKDLITNFEPTINE